uniref:C-type lectin domain-containing protein n=1 Tax=Gongylonema pulchrum TaxID=637853 RepID=A0A183D609_9BILA
LPVLQIVWEALRDSMLGKTHKPANLVGKHLYFLYFCRFTRWCLNVYDRNDNLAVDPDGLLCQSRDPKAWNGARCTRGVLGKGY